MKNILLFAALFCSLPLFAGVEDPIVQSLPGTIFVPYPANTNVNPSIPPNQINTPTAFAIGSTSWGSGFTLKSIGNLVKLYSDPNSTTLVNFDYKLSVPVKITYYKNGVIAPVNLPTEVLSITYHPNPAVQREYQQTDAFRFAEGCRVEVTIETSGITGKRLGGTPLTAQEMERVAKTVFLQSEIAVERYYNFDTAYLLCWQDITFIAQLADNSLQVQWNTMINPTTPVGAEVYDLEWIYVDDYQDYGVYTQLSSPAFLYDFNQNATRVQVKGNSYRIPLVYEHGYLLVRVRGIGRNPADNFVSPLVGRWSCGLGTCSNNCNSATGYVGSYLNRYYISNAHEGDKKNWQAVTTYAEEGKRKDVVSYFDGSMRNRQSITGLNTDRQTLVGETIYDYQGRAAIQVLPAPVNNATLKYYANFNQNLTGNPYNRQNFDENNLACNNDAAPMLPDNSGAANYYSAFNPDKTGFNAYISDADNFPFIRTEYTPDNTGRISRQGGVGPLFQLNKNHETKYFYGVPHQEELDQLFGNEAGFAAHYKKNMIIDPNGQISLTYQDAKGNTIATALAGNSPENLQQLTSYKVVPFIVNLLAHNQIDADDHALVMQETELVNTQSDYVFDYACLAPQFNYTDCDGTKYCLDCIYDLVFKITDNLNCDKVIYEKKQTVGTLLGKNRKISLQCDIFTTDVWTNLTAFTVNLLPGSYTFSKRLIVNEAAADAYVNAVLDTCPQLYNQILQAQYTQMDTSGCEVDCADAKDDRSNTTFYNGLTQDAKDALNALVEDLCDSLPVSSCEAAKAAMLSDVSPDGQYGYIPTIADPDVYQMMTSVFAPGNIYNANALAITYPNGVTYPTLDALLAAWQPEWAEELVQFHPEKCYYDFCTTYLAESDHYNALLMNTETYQDAVAAGYISNIKLQDPFFLAPNIVPFNNLLLNYVSLMNGAINSYKTSGKSMMELALIAAAYPNASPSPLNWASATPAQREQAWPIYRTLYITYKEELCYKIRTKYAITNNCYNECLGESEFNPFLNGFWNGTSSGSTNNFWGILASSTLQNNCDMYAYHYFKNKTKRFPSIYDILPDNFSSDFFAQDPTGAFNQLYGQADQNKQAVCCDSLFPELPKFLFALFNNNKSTFTLNLTASNIFPDNIEGALLHGAVQAGGTFTKDTSGVYSVVVFVPTGGTSNATSTPCSNLKFKFLQPPNGAITSFCCYTEITNPIIFTGTGVHFQMTAKNSAGATFIIEGVFSADCPFECPPKPIHCVDSKLSKELSQLFYLLVSQNKFRNGQATLPPSVIGPGIHDVFGNNTGNFTWNAPAGTSTTFTAMLSRGTQTCTFTFMQPTGLIWSQVAQAEPIQPTMTQMDVQGEVRAFKLPLWKNSSTTRVYVTGASPCFVLSDCCLPTNEECTNCPPILLGNPKPGTVLAAVTPTDCNPPCTPEEGYSRPMTNPCVQQLIDIAQHNAQEMYDDQILEMKATMKAAYMKKCLEAVERFKVTYKDARHHFTLYYYDQANNLVETVPPAGIVPLTTAQITQVDKYRNGQAVPPVYGAHTLVSRYTYNSLNQLVWQKIPDHTAATKFWYDRLGRMTASQNAKQAVTQQYSYTKYDPLGRIMEVGQIKQTVTPPIGLNNTSANWTAWLNTNNRDQITKTWYDRSALATVPQLFPNGKQENLRGRVASVSAQQTAVLPFNLPPVIWTHYSYDIHGNVKTMVQENVIIGPKVVEYEYDLISGNVNALAYQRDQPDQFLHRYAYDADNRLTTVRTSPDGVLWDKEASYKYYKHGPLARVELGDDRVQGLDYAYTLHGWIKGMNSGSLQPDRDMGKDGQNATAGNFARDATGYLLGYYDGEYKPIGTGVTFEPAYAGSNLNAATLAPSLYNGNIRNMVTAIKPFMAGQIPLATMYRYDQLNRLTSMTPDLRNFNPLTNKWLPGVTDKVYANAYTYDPNGNIHSLKRNGNKTGAQMVMDDQKFLYYPGSNKLSRVADLGALAGNYSEDIDNQPNDVYPDNYIYDEIGNLKRDYAENLTYTWNLQGKVAQIEDADAPAKTIKFGYDALGNRNSKEVSGQSLTFYAYDASGNVLATYRGSAAGLLMESAYLFGSKRLGEYRADKCIGLGCTAPSLPANHFYRFRGKRRYEESNHLGNVLATVSDRKMPIAVGANLVASYFEADVVSAQDYYPFGMLMPGRNFKSNSYRYGTFGYEKDDEVNGNGNNYTTESRPYDPRLIRWWALDPKFKLQPGWSPYKAFLCNPILYTDTAGETEYETITIKDQRTGKTTTITKVVSDEVFTDNEVHMVDDVFGGYYNQKNWYDKQTTYNVTIDKDGKVTSESSSRLVYENLERGTTSGPLMNSSAWANFHLDLPEFEGEGGVQEGGFYLTSADGGASPTKFKSMTDAEPRDVGDLLDALGVLGKGEISLIGKVSLKNKVPDMIIDLAGIVQKTIEVKEKFSKKGQGIQVECPSCTRTDSSHIDKVHGEGTYQYLKGEEKK